LPQPPQVSPPNKCLIDALLDPSVALRFNLRQWNDVLAIGFSQWLLGRLGAALDDAGLRHRIPEKARERIDAAAIAIDSSRTAVSYELNRVLRALGDIDTPLVLLKGAAYLMAGLPPARGRFIGDLDFMVPRARIAEVEGKLRARGWVATELSAYDQHYYREWTHEIPPLHHADRETPLDVHHTIVPLTARYRPDAAALMRDAVPLADRRLSVLSPADMVVHCAVHLFNEDSAKPLRDLFDAHDLLCHFGKRDEFWDELLERALLHGLSRPLYLRFAARSPVAWHAGASRCPEPRRCAGQAHRRIDGLAVRDPHGRRACVRRVACRRLRAHRPHRPLPLAPDAPGHAAASPECEIRCPRRRNVQAPTRGRCRVSWRRAYFPQRIFQRHHRRTSPFHIHDGALLLRGTVVRFRQSPLQALRPAFPAARCSRPVRRAIERGARERRVQEPIRA
jgi:hypothetical protein